MSDIFNLYVQAGSPNGDDQPQSAHRWAADEITTLRQQLEQAQKENSVFEARIAELEKSGFQVGIDYSQAFILRKQAEAVEAEAMEWPKDKYTECSHVRESMLMSAKEMRQQADEMERSNETQAT